MRNAVPLLAIVVSATTLVSCVQPRPLTAPIPPPPASVTSQKWFSVDKHNPWYWSCLVRVTPSHGPQTHLRGGMEVAWLLANECDDATDLTLTFYRDGQREEPIEFESIVNNVLKGRVKLFVGEPRRYKYTARSGRHQKDPEIVIFP